MGVPAMIISGGLEFRFRRVGMGTSSKASKWATGFYWIGVAMTVGCVGLVLAGNTKWGFRLEHMDYPVSWVMAGIGVLAFLAGEICRSAFDPDRKSEDRSSRASAQYNGAFEI